MFLKTFQLKNFKAVRDSGVVTFTPLTALIGANGSGKSSLIEGLQTYQNIVTQGLDAAMHRWRGFEYIRNPPGSNSGQPIHFALSGDAPEGGSYHAEMEIGFTENKLAVTYEELNFLNSTHLERDAQGKILLPDLPALPQMGPRLEPGVSVLSPLVVITSFHRPRVAINFTLDFLDVEELSNNLSAWQFINLNPYQMGDPKPLMLSREHIVLESDGSNIAEYLLDIRRQDPEIYTGIIDALRQVLPYADDLQPTLTTELERSVYLQLSEGKATIPGWLLSTGTLRIAALLALLRHPNPPPLIVIDEIENGLDPRTLNMLVEEMRSVVESGVSQIILTTHSPYLLDLLSLSQIIVVERSEAGETMFTRPADDDSLQAWSQRFAPGALYTAGKLSAVS